MYVCVQKSNDKENIAIKVIEYTAAPLACTEIIVRMKLYTE